MARPGCTLAMLLRGGLMHDGKGNSSCVLKGLEQEALRFRRDLGPFPPGKAPMLRMFALYANPGLGCGCDLGIGNLMGI